MSSNSLPPLVFKSFIGFDELFDEISKINPKLNLYKNSTAELVTSDSSLTDYEIEFYNDSNFLSKYLD